MEYSLWYLFSFSLYCHRFTAIRLTISRQRERKQNDNGVRSEHSCQQHRASRLRTETFIFLVLLWLFFAFNLSIGIAVASTYDYKYGFALISDAGDVKRKKGKGKILQYCDLFPRTTRYLRTMSRKVAGTDKIKRHYSGRTADKCCNHYLRSCEFSINTLPEGGWH